MLRVILCMEFNQMSWLDRAEWAFSKTMKTDSGQLMDTVSERAATI